MAEGRKSRREDLIRAGIDEINKYGIAGISMRRIADTCGVSCGAPYKHFGDRKEFIAAIIEYVNEQWYAQQKEIIAAYEGDTRRQLVEISAAYVQFLVDRPHFRAILMLKDDEFDNVYHNRGPVSSPTQALIQRYCDEENVDQETRLRKTYIVRSLIYGAMIMFDNGELPYNEQTLAIVRESIDLNLNVR